MASREERRLKRLVRQEFRAQDAEIEGFISRLDRIFEVSLEQVAGDIAFGETSAIQAAAIVGRLPDVMEELGLAEEFGRLEAIHANELQSIRDEFEELEGVNVLTTVDADIAANLIQTNVDKVAVTARQFEIDARSQLMSAILLGIEPDIPEIADQLNRQAMNRIKTEMNTALQAFNRELTVKKAVDVFGENPTFIYIGPEDNVTREFCSGLLSRQPPIYTKKEIETLDNGQPPANDVLVFGGGFNCRHRWRPVSEELEAELRK